MAERRGTSAPTADRMLAVFAHPDDESIVAGGTLAACAAAGVEVLVLCATRGEQGPIADPDLATRETLGAVREAELRAAANALGVSVVECLDYPDGELSRADRTRVGADLVRRIRQWRPEAVITFGPEGLYWHPDHVAVHEFTMPAVDILADERWDPWVYHATYPKGQMAELVSAMAARGLAADLWDLHPDDFGARPSSITTVLDVRPFLASKLRAIRCHRSQLAADNLFQAVPDDLAERFLGHEYFVRARARDANWDWLGRVVSGPAIVGGL